MQECAQRTCLIFQFLLAGSHTDFPHLWSCRYSLGRFRRCRNRSTILFLPTPYGRKRGSNQQQAQFNEMNRNISTVLVTKAGRMSTKEVSIPPFHLQLMVLRSDRSSSLKLPMASYRACLSSMADKSHGLSVMHQAERQLLMSKL